MKPFSIRAAGALLAVTSLTSVTLTSSALAAAATPAASGHAPIHASSAHRSAAGVAVDQNAPAFAAASVRAIAGTWDAQEMMKRAAPEIMTPFVRQELPNAYARLDAKLGKLKTLGTPVSDNGPPLPAKDPLANPVPAAMPVPHDGMVQHYAFNAYFERGGAARVEIVLRYRKKWQVVGLHIDSQRLQQ